MKIHNIRLGFATNSSSTHSIVLAPTLTENWNVPDDGGYGWEDFLIRSQDEKEKYLATQIMCNLKSCGFSHEYAWMITNGLVNSGSKKRAMPSQDAYIDHQSVMSMPRALVRRHYSGTPDLPELDLEFAKELYESFADNPEIAIAGGNDNQTEEEKINYGGTRAPQWRAMPLDYGNKMFICRKDGDYWTLFNKQSGTKIRMSFKKDAKPYKHSTYPELVDVKITDFCPFGCTFCFVPGTMILTASGSAPIETIKIGDTVVSHDLPNHTQVEATVEQVFERDYDGEIIDIELEDGTMLSLTPEHEVYTLNRGWIIAAEIEENDEVLKVR